MDLVFDCVGVRADRFTVTPSLTLELRITAIPEGGAGPADGPERIDAIALRCQIRIEPHKRRYSAAEAQRLHDLFGDTDRWADTLKPLQLANLSTMVAGFSGGTTVDLTLPFTYDLEIASTKYFNGLDDDVVPLLLLFSGTVFATRDGRRTVAQVPWSKEAEFGLPIKVWRDAMDLHFPNSAWLRVHRDTLDALQRFKSANALPSYDDTLVALLDRAKEQGPSGT